VTSHPEDLLGLVSHIDARTPSSAEHNASCESSRRGGAQTDFVLNERFPVGHPED